MNATWSVRRGGVVRSRRRSLLTRFVNVAVVVAVVAAGLVAVQAPQAAHALSGSEFNAGYIIDDSKFYDANAMSQAQIQAFLEANEQGACGNSLCLKTFRGSSTSHALLRSSDTGNVRCSAYPGGTNDLASSIIFKAQQACGISAKVILVTLEKEQGLVSKLTPSPAAIDRAMGFACPDTAPCAVDSLGFGNQVYKGVLQLNTYKASRFGKQPGLQTIAYSPTASCGAKTFVISNYATAALYNYTPYTPNPGALANLSGTAPCGAYGNRNFWVYFNTWFGGPTGNPQGALQAATGAANSVTVSGWAVDPDAPTATLNVRVHGPGWSQLIVANGQNAGSQAVFPGAGTNHGFAQTLTTSIGSQSVCADAENVGLGIDVNLGCTTITVPTALTVGRIQGTDRYNTAVQISTNFAPGVATAYVASGENYPDALSVAPVAASEDAPLLLTTGAAVPNNVLTELIRLHPGRIVAIGGPAAISPAALAQLATVAPVTQIQGTDRYNTSLSVGATLGARHSGKAYIASAANFPDALSGAPAAGFQDAPLILIDSASTAVTPQIRAALISWGVTTVNLIGGTTSISAALAASFAAVPGVTQTPRLGGTDRYSTSVAVNDTVFGSAANGMVAAGTAFPDGLTGSALAGRLGVPLYLSPGTCVPRGALTKFVAAGATKITFIGGDQVLTPSALAFAPCG